MSLQTVTLAFSSNAAAVLNSYTDPYANPLFTDPVRLSSLLLLRIKYEVEVIKTVMFLVGVLVTFDVTLGRLKLLGTRQISGRREFLNGRPLNKGC